MNDRSLDMLPSAMLGLRQDCGRHSVVENRTAAVAQNILDDNGCDDALLLTPDDRTDVIL